MQQSIFRQTQAPPGMQRYLSASLLAQRIFHGFERQRHGEQSPNVGFSE
jgi:hypothetical protein